MCCAGSCAARCATRSCSAPREPLMHRLVWALVREMGQAYPDLVRAEKLIEETLRLEETRFRKTLERGLSILDEKSAGLKKGDMFDGDTAFTLYDTYGFPLDLTQDALKSRGISVDQASFTDAMERQRVKARASWSGSGDAASENIWFPLREKLGATEFLGYDTESAEGVVTALVKDGKDADSLKTGESGSIVLNQTPFYAESGGQVGDTGLLTGEGVKFRVTDTQKKAGDLFVHVGTVEQGTLKVGTALQLEVDHGRRSSIRVASLGDASAARGAAAGARRSHRPARLAGGAGSAALRLRASEADHGGRARPRRGHRQRGGARKRRGDDAADGGRRRPRSRRARPVRRKIRRRGPRGLDGQAGPRAGQNALGWSVELCGGTHVRRTGDIGLISVTGESAVASGVRRIEALTGRHARKHANDTMAIAKTAASELRTTVDDMPARIAALMEERKKLERDLSDARKKLAMGGGATNGGAARRRRARSRRRQAAGAARSRASRPRTSRAWSTTARSRSAPAWSRSSASPRTARPASWSASRADLTSRFNAVELVRKGSEALGGKGGGGRPDMAQAGGPDGAKADRGAVGDRTGDGWRLGGHRSGQTREQRPGPPGPALRTARTRSSAAFGRLALRPADRRHHRPRRAGDDLGLGAGIRRRGSAGCSHRSKSSPSWRSRWNIWRGCGAWSGIRFAT